VTLDTRYRATTNNKKTTQKARKMSNIDNTIKKKKRVINSCVGTDKQFLFLMRYSLFYLNNQVIKNIVGDTRKKENYAKRRYTAI